MQALDGSRLRYNDDDGVVVAMVMVGREGGSA